MNHLVVPRHAHPHFEAARARASKRRSLISHAFGWAMFAVGALYLIKTMVEAI